MSISKPEDNLSALEQTPPSAVSPSKHIEGPEYSVDIEWAKAGQPVIYIIGQGKVGTAREALSVIEAAVIMINASPFAHVCAVYDMLALTQMPLLARFVGFGRFPSSTKTAHIIVGTTSEAIQLVASLSAVMSNRRLRTVKTCKSPEEIEQAVKRWLSLSDETRATIHRV